MTEETKGKLFDLVVERTKRNAEKILAAEAERSEEAASEGEPTIYVESSVRGYLVNGKPALIIGRLFFARAVGTHGHILASLHLSYDEWQRVRQITDEQFESVKNSTDARST